MGEGRSTLEKFAVTLPPCSSALRYPKSEALDNHSVRDKQTFSDLPALALHAVRHRVQSPARSTVQKSAMKGPIACCRRNFAPQSCRALNLAQSLLSASVCWRRNRRALLFSSENSGSIRLCPHPDPLPERERGNKGCGIIENQKLL